VQGRIRPVRVSVKAVVIQDGRLLVTRNVDDEGDFFLLPGGGQEPGESLPEALQRECREEVGAHVEVHDLVLVRDYIGRNHEFAATNSDFHQVELMFRCTIRGDAPIGNGSNPDGWQIGVEWLDVASLQETRLYPAVLRRVIPALDEQGTVYLGDVN
jgi:ADP-ribose pyrophosphatase YjhB (NUDIX family)